MTLNVRPSSMISRGPVSATNPGTLTCASLGPVRSSVRKDVAGNPLDLIKNVRIVPSDLSLGKNYVQIRDEYRDLLGLK